MKFVKLFVFIFLFKNLYAQVDGFTPSLPIQETEVYKNSNIYQQDFLYLCQGLINFHANVFLNFSKDEFNKEKEFYYKQLATCNNENEFGIIANKFTNKIKDAHTGVQLGRQNENNYLYPYRCKYLIDTLVIMAVSDHLPFSLCGEKIKSINGIDIKILEKMAAEVYVEENYIGLQKSIMQGINSTEYLKSIGVINSDSEKVKILTYSTKEFEAYPNSDGIWKSQIPKTPLITERVNEPFIYKIIKEDSLCYIQFNKMVDKRVGEMYLDLLPWYKRWITKTLIFFGASGGLPNVYFEDFLNACIDDITKNNLKKVIVDLRWNAGGSSSLGNTLLYAFGIDKFKSYSSEVNKSDLYRLQMEALGLSEDNIEVEDNSDGFYYTKQAEGAENIKQRINCDVYLITSEWTFSSALMLATIVKDNNLFVVVGEPTLGKPSHFGELLFLKLPNTNLVCSLSSKLFHRPDKTKDNEATLYPDVTIFKTYSDIISGIDRVYKWIVAQ